MNIPSKIIMDFMNQKISKSWSQFKRFKGSPQEDKYFQKYIETRNLKTYLGRKIEKYENTIK